MRARIIISYVGNLIDIIGTLYFVGLGCQELNPLMAWLLQWPGLFVTVKLFVMSLFVWATWNVRESRVSDVCSWIASVLYGLIGLYYIGIFLFMCATLTGGALVI